MSYAFVDRHCPRCNGKGNKKCPLCEGVGMIGRLEEVPDLPRKEPSEFAKMLRKTRERRMVTMSELAVILKCKVSRISEIELGMIEPTDKERKALEAWISQN